MDVINVRKFGLAVGLTFAVLRILCILVFIVTDPEKAATFFNTLVHGIDVTPILRMEMSWAEMIYGILQIFILGWLIGALIASIYNFRCKKCDCQ